MSESDSGQTFNRTTFGGERGEVDNGTRRRAGEPARTATKNARLASEL